MNHYIQTTTKIRNNTITLPKAHNITHSWQHAQTIKIDKTNTITLHIQINLPNPTTITGYLKITHNQTNNQKQHTLTAQTTNPKNPSTHTWIGLTLPTRLGTITITTTITPENQ